MSLRSIALFAITLVACGDDAVTTPDTSQPDVPDTVADTSPGDVLADTAPDVAPDTGPTLVTERFRFAGPGSLGPLRDARVNVVMPDGKRYPMRTDSDGRLVVEGVDYSKGPLGYFILELPDRPGAAVLGMRQHDWDRVRDEDGVILQPSVSTQRSGKTYRLSGEAKNLHPQATVLNITSDLGAGGFEGSGPSWAIEGIPEKTAGAFVATQRDAPLQTGRALNQTILGWLGGIIPPLTADSTLELDFLTTLSAQTSAGTFQAPVGDTDAFAQRFRMWVAPLAWTSAGRQWLLIVGMPTKLDVDANGLISYEVEHIAHESATSYFTRFLVQERELSSWVDVHGPPPSGSADVALFPIPRMGSPGPMALDETLYWDTPPEGAVVGVTYETGLVNERTRVLQVFLPPGTTAFDLAALPELRQVVAPLESLSVSISFCDLGFVEWVPNHPWCRSYSNGAHIAVTTER